MNELKHCNCCHHEKSLTDFREKPDGFLTANCLRCLERKRADRLRSAPIRTERPAHNCERVPVGPFLEWYLAYERKRRMQADLTRTEVCAELRLQTRRVTAYLNGESKHTSLIIVDTALTLAYTTVNGVYCLDDLYPYEAAQAA